MLLMKVHVIGICKRLWTKIGVQEPWIEISIHNIIIGYFRHKKDDLIEDRKKM